MGWTIGIPSLKLNNTGTKSKHCGNFKSVAEEALMERKGMIRISTLNFLPKTYMSVIKVPLNCLPIRMFTVPPLRMPKDGP